MLKLLHAFLMPTDSNKGWLKWFIAVIWGCCLLLEGTIAWGGGGPENVLLVVNADSASSKLIANHYIAGRQIPPSHVVYLNGIPDREMIDLKTFREQILKPIFAHLESKAILPSIDYIVYSADFPTVININPDRQRFLEFLKNQQANQPGQLPDTLFNGRASINAMTYYAALVMTNQFVYLAPDANTYYRGPADLILTRPFVGERQADFEQAIDAYSLFFDLSGELIEELGAESKRQIDEAVKTLVVMSQANPEQLGVLYWLARFYARLGQPAESQNRLVQAIRGGWSYRSYTLNDAAFASMIELPVFKGIVARIPDEPFEVQPTIGFKHTFPWAVNGGINREPGQGNRYFLSTVLAVTRNYATNEQQALRQLQTSIKADSTFPQGKFYFSSTSDVRSKTRTPQFAAAMAALKRLGYESQIINQPIPGKVDDVLGLSTGTAKFNWLSRGSRIVPGAICENLTSYGGIVSNNSQTKLFEFITHKAAGSSGTVVEPYAVAFKFPQAMIHAHYVRGCSLAEAYYQAVQNPFQLLIVGDALCQPWAKPPEFQVSKFEDGKKQKGTITIELEWNQDAPPAAGFELYVAGRLTARSTVRDNLAIDTTGLADGYHELRVVAIGADSIQSNSRQIIPVVIANHGRQADLQPARNEYLETDVIKLTASSNFGDAIELIHNGRAIAKERLKKDQKEKIGREVEFSIPARLLGRGPVRLTALAIDEASGEVASSSPVDLLIDGLVLEGRRFTTDVKSPDDAPP